MKQQVLILAAMMLAGSCVSGQKNGRQELVSPALKSGAGNQELCPVMEGKRIHDRLFVDYHGFRIFVCCNACVKAVRKDPGRYLTRLQNQGVVLQKTD